MLEDFERTAVGRGTTSQWIIWQYKRNSVCRTCCKDEALTSTENFEPCPMDRFCPPEDPKGRSRPVETPSDRAQNRFLGLQGDPRQGLSDVNADVFQRSKRPQADYPSETLTG